MLKINFKSSKIFVEKKFNSNHQCFKRIENIFPKILISKTFKYTLGKNFLCVLKIFINFNFPFYKRETMFW